MEMGVSAANLVVMDFSWAVDGSHVSGVSQKRPKAGGKQSLATHCHPARSGGLRHSGGTTPTRSAIKTVGVVTSILDIENQRESSLAHASSYSYAMLAQGHSYYLPYQAG